MDAKALAALAETKMNLDEGSFLDFKKTHLHLFERDGFHHLKTEDYRYTPLKTFFEGFQFTPGEETTPVSGHNPDFHTLTFIDGHASSVDMNVPGMKVSSLKEKFAHYQDLFQGSNPLSSLHHAFLTDGVVLEIDKNVTIEKPIRIVNFCNRTNVTAPTVILKMARMSSATLFEENIGLASSYLSLSETYVILDEGAKLEHVKLERGTPQGLHHGETRAQVAKDATYRNFLFHLEGKLNRTNLKTELNEPGAHAETFDLYLTGGSEHSDLNTVIHHLAADTTSQQIAKGILDGESKGIFTGRIHIHPKAQRVNSGQLNKNLLLSKKAQVHSQPQLEIFADDVKCSHGSTTGQLSPDEIFYFEARGIPREKAKTLLAHGFGLEIVQRIESSPVKKVVEALILEKLKTKFNLGGAHGPS